MTVKTYVVTEEDVDVRLDKLLTKLNENYSRQQIQTWIKEQLVTVNDEQYKANYKCKLGDRIQWEIPEEEEIEIKPESIPLDILYEDDYLIVINKAKGMLVHPTQTETSGTLVNALMYHCKQLSNLNGDERPGIVHRLDKDTSGLLVAAKDNVTHEQLKVQFQEQTVERIYEAIVFGVISHSSGIIKAPIGRNPKNRLQMAVVSDGKYAETHFRVIERFKEHTHVQCELKTGRTHQIRVHLKYMNHPIVGDELYVRKKSTLIQGQALFAKLLSFHHPHTNERMTFTIDRPKDFEKLLHFLRNSS